MGASDTVARTLKKAIQEEAEAMLSDKKVVNSAVNIAGNTEKIKVRGNLCCICSIHISGDGSSHTCALVLTTSCVMHTGNEGILAALKSTRGQ